MKYLIISVFFALSLVSFSTVSAQATGIATTINADMVPENPGPNEQVTVTLTSYNTDLNAANITWRVNGKTGLSGKGEKVFNFTTGAMNTTTTLDITVITKEGETITRNFRMRPVQVDLVWEAQSFTPPFYRGKAMFSYQNRVTFNAYPHIYSGGVEISPKNLIYKWTLNGSIVDTASGYGKNSYSFTSPLISRGAIVTVDVTSPATADVGTQTISIEPIDPSVIMYRKNPLYGIQFQKALTNTVALSDSKEITVVGMPYFFGAGTLSFAWSLNGKGIGNNPSQSAQVFRQTDNSSGTSNISLRVENSSKILELANSNFNLNFGETQ